MTSQVCLVCASKTATKKHPLMSHRKISVYSCPNCSSEFLNPLPSDDELKSIYEKIYQVSWGYGKNSDDTTIDSIKKATFRKLFYRIFEYLPYRNGRRILDIGCANGSLLGVAQEHEFTLFGVELSSFSCEIARKKFPESIIVNVPIEKANFEKEYFDLITMSDMIEHVRRPGEILKKCFDFLKSDGLLVLITPDKDSFYSRIMGRYWTEYKIEHLTYLNKKSLRILGEDSGLEMIYAGRFVKTMNLDYIYHQFQVFRNKLITPVLSIIYKTIPDALKFKNFKIYLGSLCAFFRKKG